MGIDTTGIHRIDQIVFDFGQLSGLHLHFADSIGQRFAGARHGIGHVGQFIMYYLLGFLG